MHNSVEWSSHPTASTILWCSYWVCRAGSSSQGPNQAVICSIFEKTPWLIYFALSFIHLLASLTQSLCCPSGPPCLYSGSCLAELSSQPQQVWKNLFNLCLSEKAISHLAALFRFWSRLKAEPVFKASIRLSMTPSWLPTKRRWWNVNVIHSLSNLHY